MSVDATKVMYYSGFNAFKNNTYNQYSFSLPATISNNASYTASQQFTLTKNISFIEIYVYGTDYGEYFRYLDSNYHNNWTKLSPTAGGYLLLNSPVTSLWYYSINYTIVNNVVTVTLTTATNTSGGTLTLTPNMTVPIVFVDYTLAN